MSKLFTFAEQAPTAGTRPEVEVLLCCARTCMDTARAERLRALLQGDMDWTCLIRMAERHKVTPLLYCNLNTICPELVPPTVLSQLQRQFNLNGFRNLFLSRELCKLLSLFEAHRIPAIPYKGPVLAASIYGNLALRQCGDLDILVRERDYQSAQQMLSAQGFHLTIEHEWEQEWQESSGRFAVDLHKRLAPREFPSPLNFEYLWKRTQPVVLAGRTAPSLSPEDTLLMLSIQVMKDSYCTLARVCDIAALLRLHPGLNSTQFLAYARTLGGRRMVLFALCLARNLLGVELAQDVERALAVQRPIQDVAAHASQQFFAARDSPVQKQLTAQRVQWLVRERVRDKILPYYLRFSQIIVPIEKDRALLSLPPSLTFLYYLLRPFRLMWEHGVRLPRILLKSLAGF